MKQKNIISKDGFIVKSVFVDENNNILFTNLKLEEGQSLVEEQPIKDLIKPSWNGLEWTEGATEEEIKECNEINKITQEPTENEILMSNIMLENATLKQQMEEQQELTSTLMLQIAELKGGNTNV